MPAIMMSPDVGSMPNVIRINRAMLAAGPIPGRMPTMVPMNTPTKVYHRLIGCRQTLKPWRICPRVSISEWQYAGGKLDAEQLGECEITAETEQRGCQDIGFPFAAVEIRRQYI